MLLRQTMATGKGHDKKKASSYSTFSSPARCIHVDSALHGYTGYHWVLATVKTSVRWFTYNIKETGWSSCTVWSVTWVLTIGENSWDKNTNNENKPKQKYPANNFASTENVRNKVKKRTTHQSAFKTGSIIVATSHDQQRLLLVQFLGQGMDLVIDLQHLLNLLCKKNTNQVIRDPAIVYPKAKPLMI